MLRPCHRRLAFLSALLPLLLLLLPGCIQFHPRNPPWLAREAAGAGAAGATGATGVAEAPGPARSSAPSAAAVLEPMWRLAGHSVEGRPLRVAQVGHGPRRVLWIGGIHGDEREGSVATRELPAALAARPGALEQVTLTLLEDANPDGTAQNRRHNANGVDLNRNYPAANFKPHRMFGIRPLSQPEARTVHDLVLEVRPHLVIVAHSWRNDRFVNFDGPAEHLAVRFGRLSSYPVRVSQDIAPTPGSLGSWVGKTLGIPILTLEYRRGTDPQVAWRETREAILGVVLDA